jgi:hypothetical protein
MRRYASARSIRPRDRRNASGQYSSNAGNAPGSCSATICSISLLFSPAEAYRRGGVDGAQLRLLDPLDVLAVPDPLGAGVGHLRDAAEVAHRPADAQLLARIDLAPPEMPVEPDNAQPVAVLVA